jgi:hypothetical protein
MQSLSVKKYLLFSLALFFACSYLAWVNIFLPSSSSYFKGESVLGTKTEIAGELSLPLWSGFADIDVEKNTINLDIGSFNVPALVDGQFIIIRDIREDNSCKLQIETVCLDYNGCNPGKLKIINDLVDLFGASKKIPLELYEVSLYN